MILLLPSFMSPQAFIFSIQHLHPKIPFYANAVRKAVLIFRNVYYLLQGDFH